MSKKIFYTVLSVVAVLFLSCHSHSKPKAEQVEVVKQKEDSGETKKSANSESRNLESEKSKPSEKTQSFPVPPGAAELGYTKCVIQERPTAADIASEYNGKYKWFNGACWDRKSTSLDHYGTTKDGELSMTLHGESGLGAHIMSTPRDFSEEGLLPTLPGEDGFYVEFDYRLSDNDPDHFPAVWLMPVEHSLDQKDHYEGDPKGFERWMELDVDEPGFGPGMLATVISWTGIWPNYKRELNGNHMLPTPLDRTVKHTFGASFDPKKKKVTWWLDGEWQIEAGPPYVPDVALKQHFYLIMNTWTHAKDDDPKKKKKEPVPFTMYISGVRAYVPPSSPIPSVDERKP